MADKKREAPADGRDGIDRFSCNGYGLKLDGVDVKPVATEETEEIEEVEGG